MVPEAEEAVVELFAARQLQPSRCRVSVRGKSFEGRKARLAGYLDELGVYQELFRALDVRVFQGAIGYEGPHLYAIAQLPPLELIELFEVGTHNNGETSRREVKALMATVAEQDPFDVVFADAAGLAVTFRREVRRENAQRYAARLLDDVVRGYSETGASGHFLDSVELMMGDAGPPSEEASDYLGQMAIGVVDFIVRKRRLRLWWD